MAAKTKIKFTSTEWLKSYNSIPVWEDGDIREVEETEAKRLVEQFPKAFSLVDTKVEEKLKEAGEAKLKVEEEARLKSEKLKEELKKAEDLKVTSNKSVNPEKNKAK